MVKDCVVGVSPFRRWAMAQWYRFQLALSQVGSLMGFGMHCITISLLLGAKKAAVLVACIVIIMFVVLWFVGYIIDRIGYVQERALFETLRNERWMRLEKNIDYIIAKLKEGKEEEYD